MNKKFIESKKIDEYEVLTDSGWVNIEAIHKTVKYQIYHLKTELHDLFCADNHIVFSNNKEVFVKDLKPNDIIESIDGPTKVLSIEKTSKYENMYDLELDSESNKRYYTNGILSHNTTYLRYLASKLRKDIIFISSDMVSSITDPAFIPFLMNNNNSILIIEDAEPALEKREKGRSSAVTNILNLTDGLLSDCLNISVIATFNTSADNIDDALLRKGRLLMHYKFERLSIEKSKKLLESLGHKDVEVKEPMKLSDIYFYGKDNNAKLKDKDKVKIGFK